MTYTTDSLDTIHVEPDRPVSNLSLAKVHRDFNAQTIKAGISFGDEGEHNLFTALFIAALATKPFAILSGLSGSGKTLLATTFGQWLGRDQLLLQPVRPDWISPESLLGYEDRHSATYDGQYGWQVPRVLEFVLSATRDPYHPYVLVLEEMNLAHVERYFADVLSGMESGQPIVPNLQNDSTGWRLISRDNQYLAWPKNLFTVGTINVDETTYEFSPKVLDRASVIEFRVPPGSLLRKYPARRQIQRTDNRISEAFLQRALGEERDWDGQQKVSTALEKVHELLYQYGAEFGHRVFHESLRYAAMLGEIGLNDPAVILDQILVQRVLPKFDTTAGAVDENLIRDLAGVAVFGPEAARPVDPLDPPNANVMLPKSLAKLRKIAANR